MISLPPGFGLLRTRLLLLTLLTLGPVFLLALYGNLQQRRVERTSVEEQIAGTARLVAASEGNLFHATRQLLASVSQYDFLVGNNNQAYSSLQCMYLRVLAPEHANFGLIEKDGTLFCNAERTNASLRMNDRSYFQLAARRHQFVVGNFQPDPLVDEPCLTVAYPTDMVTNHSIPRLFFASLKLSVMAKNLAAIPLPPGGVSWVIDETGNVLARNPDPEKLAGKNLSTMPFVQRAIAGSPGAFEAADVNGASRLFAAAPVSDGYSSNIIAIVGVPRSLAYAQADAALLRNLVVLSGIALFALGTAWWFGQRLILHPVNTLVTTAGRLSRGDLAARTGISGSTSELNQLARAFDGMAESLEERQLELKNANDEITRMNAELEGRVKNRTAQLEAANQELESFSHSVSHDLRAPLRHIAGYVEILGEQEAVKHDETSRRYIKMIVEAALRMGKLVDDLLAFSRMGRAEMQLMEIKLEPFVQKLRGELMLTVPQRQIEWQIGPLPEVRADPALLRQALENLLSNAVKYTRKRDRAKIEIGSLPGEAEHIVFVRDNGAGFDMKYVGKLFGVFQRLHDLRDFEGTGIGLANVQRIIQRHRGRVWAEGAVGQGATFYFSLPK